MARYVIEGSRAIAGTLIPAGNKNESLPALAACLLTSEPVTLRRMPRIKDVDVMLRLLGGLGVRYEWTAPDVVALQAQQLSGAQISAAECTKVRAAILLLGPLLARLGEVKLPLPGGDVIGARKIDCHFEGLRALGCEVSLGEEIRGVLPAGPRGGYVFMEEPSVTATENTIMCAVLADGESILDNVACEPHVVGLCKMLQAMGAQITGVGSNRLVIKGVSQLGGVDHAIGPDFMEVASYLCLAGASGGQIKIEGVDPQTYRGIVRPWEKLGLRVQSGADFMAVDGREGLRVHPDISGRVPTIYSAPWPGFPTDLMSVAIVAATQAQGTILFFEKMFEGRMFFTDRLISMGAQIVLCDPHRVVVTGKTQLYGARISSPDVRAGMALIMAACMARGTSEIDNVYLVERGYDRVVEKLTQLGVAIRRHDT